MSAADWFKSRKVLVGKIRDLRARVERLEATNADILSDYGRVNIELMAARDALSKYAADVQVQKKLLAVSEALRDKEHAELEAARKELAAHKTNKWSHLPKSPKWDFKGGW